MKLLIDSEPVTLKNPDQPDFKSFCTEVMQLLLEKNRSISKVTIDGVYLDNVKDADALYKAAVTIEIESLPLNEALSHAIDIKLQELRGMEERCEQLVTDSLLAEPGEIVNQWQQLCEQIKQIIGFVPSLAPVLTEEYLEVVIEKDLKELGLLMQEAAKSFSGADVVSFSDVLETRLLPWFKKLRMLFETAKEAVNKMPKEGSST